MSKKIVYICSPLRGNYEQNIKNARNYCRETMLRHPDVVPLAPHIYFTQFLNDHDPIERSLGIDAGIELLKICDEIWVFGVESPSEGMRREMEYAMRHNIPIFNCTTEKEGANI